MTGASYDFLMAPLEALGMRDLRSRFLRSAQGKILEIGAGTGLNLAHYSEGTRVTALEPDDSKRKRAALRLKKRESSTKSVVQIVPGDAEQMTFEGETFDTVIATLVFCTIPRPQEAMNEAYRVLKPGGCLCLLEHVRSPHRAVGKIQDWATPVWKIFAEGCHLNRDPEELALKAGFIPIEKKIIWKGLGKILRYNKSIP